MYLQVQVTWKAETVDVVHCALSPDPNQFYFDLIVVEKCYLSGDFPNDKWKIVPLAEHGEINSF